MGNRQCGRTNSSSQYGSASIDQMSDLSVKKSMKNQSDDFDPTMPSRATTALPPSGIGLSSASSSRQNSLHPREIKNFVIKSKSSVAAGISPVFRRRSSYPSPPSARTETKTPTSHEEVKDSRRVTLDEESTDRLRRFYERNRRANQRHFTMMARENEAIGMQILHSARNSQERLDLYDVFSPDMRSTRWQEFLEKFSQQGEEKEQYELYKSVARNVRGSNKAMTLAGVTRGESVGNDGGNVGFLH